MSWEKYQKERAENYKASLKFSEIQRGVEPLPPTKLKAIASKVTLDVYRKLKKMSEVRGTTPSGIIRGLIEDLCENE